MPKTFRTDADASYFLENELDSIKEKVYEEYPDPAFSNLIPVDSSDDEGADYVGYTMYNRTGISEIISAGTADSPAVDASGSKTKKPVFEIGNHFSYTSKELRNAKFAGAPLESDKVYASAQAVEQHHDDIAILGDGTKDKRFGGMYGIVFNPNVTKMVAPKTFATSTASEILAEFAKMKKQIIKDTKQVHLPDTWGLSTDLVAYLEGVMVTGTSVSVMERLKSTYSDMKFETHYRLIDVEKNPTTDAVEATTVIMCYKKNPRVLKYVMPMPWRTMTPVPTGRGSKTETESSTAGVIVKQPLAVVIYHSF